MSEKTIKETIMPKEIILPKGNIFKKLGYLVSTVGAGAILMSINMGPGTATSCLSAGASYGYNLLWLVMASGFLGGVISYLGGKVTAVTGKNVLENISEVNSTFCNILMGLILITYYRLMMIMGSTMKHLTEIIFGNKLAFIAYTVTILVILYVFTSGKDKVIKIATLFCTAMALVLLFNIFWVKPDPIEMLKGVMPSIPTTKEEAIMLAGIIGGSATGLIGMVYSFNAKDAHYTNPKYLKNMIVDQTYFNLLFTIFSAGIFISGAAVLKPAGITVTSALDASQVLQPLAGQIGKWIFIFGLWGAVFTTIGGLGYLTANVGCSLFKKSTNLNEKPMKIFIAFGIALSFFGAYIKAPALPNLVGGVGSLNIMGAILAIVILYITNSKKHMGEYVNKLPVNIFGTIILLLNLYSAYRVLF